MKVLIDKHGGTHYHKKGCEATDSINNPQGGHYEEVGRDVTKSPLLKEYIDIKVDGRWYLPCPFCFGHGSRRTLKGVVER